MQNEALWRLAYSFTDLSKKHSEVRDAEKFNLFFEHVKPYMNQLSAFSNAEEGFRSMRENFIKNAAGIADAILSRKQKHVEQRLSNSLELNKQLYAIEEIIISLDASQFSDFAACSLYYELLSLFDVSPKVSGLFNNLIGERL